MKAHERPLLEAVALIQRFVCALEEGRMLHPALSKTLPSPRTHADRLVMERLLSEISTKLDVRGDAAALSEKLGLPRAVEVLAARRLGAMQAGSALPAFRRLGLLSDVANERGYSVRTLSRISDQEAGLPAGEVRRREVMCGALGMLADGMKGLAVATECGYKSERGFYAVFRKYTGMTPAASRRLSASERAAIQRRLLPWKKAV